MFNSDLDVTVSGRSDWELFGDPLGGVLQGDVQALVMWQQRLPPHLPRGLSEPLSPSLGGVACHKLLPCRVFVFIAPGAAGDGELRLPAHARGGVGRAYGQTLAKCAVEGSAAD